MDIRLDPITPERKRAFAQLINLYNFNYDFTNYLNDDIPEEGFFYGDADYYMSHEKAQNFFIRVDGKIAGYAVIMTGDCHYLDDPAAHSIDEFLSRGNTAGGASGRSPRFRYSGCTRECGRSVIWMTTNGRRRSGTL